MSALSEEDPVPEDVRGLSGAQYKDKVVSRLFRARWPGAVSVGMCQMLRDLDLGERQLSVAVSRVLRHLRKSAKLHDLPPLTYQLLLLAGRCAAACNTHLERRGCRPHPLLAPLWELYKVVFGRVRVGWVRVLGLY